ncbi:unnamed protein product [Cochlearia groenlandica]
MAKSWFSAVKKALTQEPKQNKEQKPHNAKKLDPLPNNTTCSIKDAKGKDIEEKQRSHAYSVAIATATAAKAAVAAAKAASEVVRLTALLHSQQKSKEDIAAIKIQTAFRRFMAMRALYALRGLVKLKSLIQEKCVRGQATSTYQNMQTLVRLQYQILDRRLQLSKDKQAYARKLQQKHKDFDKTGENWDDDNALLLEKVEANMLNKKITTFMMDPNNPHCGWSWLERWIASQQYQNQTTTPDETMVPRGKITKVKQVTSGDEDSKSILSVQPCKHRLNTRENVSSTSKRSKPAPGYMAPTQAAKERARLSNFGTLGSDKTSKKRFSSSGSPKIVSRFSGPAKL